MTEYFQLCRECSNAGVRLMHDLAAEGKQETLYLYARHTTTDQSGMLALVPDSQPAPEGFHLVTPEGLKTSIPYGDYLPWVLERAKRAPILSLGV